MGLQLVKARAVVEGQIMSMRGHAERYGVPSPPKRLIATGSSSVNRAFLYIAACVFGCELYTIRRSAVTQRKVNWSCNCNTVKHNNYSRSFPIMLPLENTSNGTKSHPATRRQRPFDKARNSPPT